jgi:hypothetical protein
MLRETEPASAAEMKSPSDSGIGAEKLGSSLGVMSAIFYFMPFVITVLIIVGVPLIQTISGQ